MELLSEADQEQEHAGKLIDAARYFVQGGEHAVEALKGDAKAFGVNIETLLDDIREDFGWVNENGDFELLAEYMPTFRAFVLAYQSWDTHPIMSYGMKKPHTIVRNIPLVEIKVACEIAEVPPDELHETVTYIISMAQHVKPLVAELVN